MKKNKIINFLNKAEKFTLVTMFVTMVVIIFVQVIMRKIFNSSLSWSEELGKFIFVWISWLGISVGQMKGEHIKITAFVDKLPPKGQNIMNILAELVVIWICGITAYYSYTLVLSQASTPYAGIKISMSFGYLSVLVGCILMVFRCILSILEQISLLKGKESRGK